MSFLNMWLSISCVWSVRNHVETYQYWETLKISPKWQFNFQSGASTCVSPFSPSSSPHLWVRTLEEGQHNWSPITLVQRNWCVFCRHCLIKNWIYFLFKLKFLNFECFRSSISKGRIKCCWKIYKPVKYFLDELYLNLFYLRFFQDGGWHWQGIESLRLVWLVFAASTP